MAAVLSASFGLLHKGANGLENCIPPLGLLNKTNGKLDFPTCLQNVTAIRLSLANNDSVATAWSQSGCLNGNVSEAILSRSGCNEICGRGRQFWPRDETSDRLSLLVIPALVLMAHLSFPPLPWQNYLFTIWRVVGNPIGSLESLLMRFEEHRRLRRAAKRILTNHQDDAEKVATIFAAFEEIGWQDVSEHFAQSYEAQPLCEEEARIIRIASHELSTMRSVSIMSAFVAIVTLVVTLATAIVRTIKAANQENTRVSNETAHTIAVVSLLFISIPQVWFSARLGNFTTATGALHTLTTMNTELRKASQPRSQRLFPPLGLAACPLQLSAGGFYLYPCPLRPRRSRPASARENQDADGHVLLDNFDSTDAERRHQHRRKDKDQDESGSESIIQIRQVLMTEGEEESESHITEQFWQDWLDGAKYLGIHASWRPCTHKVEQPSLQSLLRRRSPRDRSAGVVSVVFQVFRDYVQGYHLQIISFVMITFGACLPAIFISATNHTNRRRIGLGCRSLTWVLIMSVWVLNYFQLDRIVRVDRLFRRLLCRKPANDVPEDRLRWLWQYSLIKDAIITGGIAAGVLMVEIGLWNSCYCRSSFTDMVNLNPYYPDQWAQAQKIWIGVPGGGLFIIAFLILGVELRGVVVHRSIRARERGSPLCKTKEQMQDEARHLNQPTSRN